jgi:predicted ATPase
MGCALDKLTIQGFKSIKSLEEFELTNLNLLIGGNGAGKSNFIDFFRMLCEMMRGKLATYIKSHGGCDDYIFNGPKYTTRVEMKLKFKKRYEYSCSLLPTVDESFMIEKRHLERMIFLAGLKAIL